MTEFYDKSPLMTQKLAQPKRNSTASKHPWATVPVGKCFVVPCNEAKLSTMKSQASRKGRKLGRKFAVVQHDNHAIIEICCLSETAIVGATDTTVKSAKPATVDNSPTVQPATFKYGMAFDANGRLVEPAEPAPNVGTIPDFGFDK